MAVSLTTLIGSAVAAVLVIGLLMPLLVRAGLPLGLGLVGLPLLTWGLYRFFRMHQRRDPSRRAR